MYKLIAKVISSNEEIVKVDFTDNFSEIRRCANEQIRYDIRRGARGSRREFIYYIIERDNNGDEIKSEVYYELLKGLLG